MRRHVRARGHHPAQRHALCGGPPPAAAARPRPAASPRLPASKQQRAAPPRLRGRHKKLLLQLRGGRHGGGHCGRGGGERSAGVEETGRFEGRMDLALCHGLPSIAPCCARSESLPNRVHRELLPSLPSLFHSIRPWHSSWMCCAASTHLPPTIQPLNIDWPQPHFSTGPGTHPRRAVRHRCALV